MIIVKYRFTIVERDGATRDGLCTLMALCRFFHKFGEFRRHRGRR